MSRDIKDEYDPAEWLGMSKGELAALDRLARYNLDGKAYSGFKTVQKHMPRLIALGVASANPYVATEKGKELVRKLARWYLEDHGICPPRNWYCKACGNTEQAVDCDDLICKCGSNDWSPR